MNATGPFCIVYIYIGYDLNTCNIDTTKIPY